MDQELDYEKAMKMVQEELREMKMGLGKIGAMALSSQSKQYAFTMRRIYQRLDELINQFSMTHSYGDFNNVCRELEALKPSFVLNYNEICYTQSLQTFNEALDEMEAELARVDQLEGIDRKREKVEEMHAIYEKLYHKVSRFAESREEVDCASAEEDLRALEPTFTLNYHELTGD